MDEIKFKRLIQKRSRNRQDAEILLAMIVDDNQYVSVLIDAISNGTTEDAIYNARILELAMKLENRVILHHLDPFCSLIHRIEIDAPIRAFAKIIELLCVEFFIKFNPIHRDCIQPEHLEQFTEACFDWMIANKATAIQAHSMYALYLLGQDIKWIYPELIETINRNMPDSSIGYQNRGRKIIQAIKSGDLLKLY